ncbi:MAG TPA: ATP-binding protein [Dictyobacter sp.]|jgi:signal transduction histidine kinase|nr:ATP-binding protein [Dictyobacter sp.]
MTNLKQLYWDLRYRIQPRNREPGAALFNGLRLRLTFWYSGILAIALLLFCVALYFGVQRVLYNSVQSNISSYMQIRQQQWQHDPNTLCAPFDPSSHHDDDQNGDHDQSYQSYLPNNTLLVCYDQNGVLQPYNNSDMSALPKAFLSNDLAKQVLQTNRPAHNIVTDKSEGDIYRYAMVVWNPNDPDQCLVLQMGEPIEQQESALHILLILMLIVGGVALLGAGLGGLFLANRALTPARLAFNRQQQFIADASHELRTPLTLLRADAEVLLRGRNRFSEDDASCLEDIVAETNHMARLANSMLSLARLDAVSRHQEFEIVNLDDLARAAVRRVSALAEEKHITVSGLYSDSALVIGDPLLLEQLVFILLDNAIKYNRAGGQVTIQTQVLDKQAVVSVQDSGIGIAAEHLTRLGERFYRVDKARSREAGGTGLGLSIAHGIAAAHKGTLTMESVINQGTTVTLRLPSARPHEQPSSPSALREQR